MRRSIVVVGSVNLDLVCTGKRIPAPGETVRGTDFKTFHGGKGANQAVAVSRLGYPVSMIAKVGDDEFGGRLRQGLRAAQVNVRAVGTAAGTASGVALITVDTKGQNSITVIPGANAELLPRDLEKALPQLRSAGIILTQLETPIETVEYLCTVANRFQVPLMLDPAPACPLTRKMLRNVTYLTPNETETCDLCDVPSGGLSPTTVVKLAEALQNGGAANVIVKMGSHGVYVAGADGLRRMVPAFKVRVVDSTAAGDAFNGGLAVALMRGMKLEEAVRFGAAVGAMSVTRKGAQPAMPTASEVAELLNRGGRKLICAGKQPPRKLHT
ncbi:MAG: ribokinase [Acidobacteriaceae bacterium]